MAHSKTIDIVLERLWDGHAAGEIVAVEETTGLSMIRKKYGHKVTAAERKKLVTSKAPPVETAAAPPQANTADNVPPVETATAPPQKSKLSDQPDKTDKKKGR